MLKSIWFWIILILGAVVVWLAWGQIEARLPKTMVGQPTRTTNTQQLAKTIEPSSGSDMPDRAAVSSNSRIATPATPRASGANTTSSTTRKLSTTTSSGTAVVVKAVKSTSTSRAATASSKSITYVVKTGDTLYSIARKYGLDVKTLASTNKLADPDNLKAGAKLIIPITPVPTPRPVTPPPGATTYTVRAGDTLSSIARRHGTSVGDLQRINKLSNPNQLVVGMTLVVPGSGSSSGQPSPTPNRSTTSAPAQPVASPTPNANSALPTPVSQSTGQTASPPTAPTNTTQPSTDSVSQVPLVTATFTPRPDEINPCPAGRQVVLVWGVSFCLPDGWTATERGKPDRGVYLVQDAASDRALIAIVRPGGWPNAPTSWALRSAKGLVQEQAATQLPSGISKPENWTDPRTVTVAGLPAQMVEATTTFNATNRPARVRVLVFNQQGQWWYVILLAPQERWGYYTEAGFPTITNSLSVF